MLLWHLKGMAAWTAATLISALRESGSSTLSEEAVVSARAMVGDALQLAGLKYESAGGVPVPAHHAPAVVRVLGEMLYLDAWTAYHSEPEQVATWMGLFRSLLLVWHGSISARLHARVTGVYGIALAARVRKSEYTPLKAPEGVYAPSSKREEVGLLLLLHQVVTNDPLHDLDPLDASAVGKAVAEEYGAASPGVAELVLTFALGGQYALVGEGLELVLTHSATDMSILVQYALSLEACGEFHRAALTLERASKLAPQSAFIHILRAKLYLAPEVKNTPLGLTAASHALRLLQSTADDEGHGAPGAPGTPGAPLPFEPSHEQLVPLALRLKGALLAQGAREARLDADRESAHSLALETLSLALEADPVSSHVVYALALLNAELRNYPAAIDYLRRLLRLEPQSSRGWHLLAVLLTGTKDLQAALGAINAGLDADPDSLEMLATKADIVERISGGRKALPIFEEMIRVWNKLHKAGTTLLASLHQSGNSKKSPDTAVDIPSVTYLAPRANSVIARSMAAAGEAGSSSGMHRSPSSSSLAGASGRASRTASIGYISPAMLAQYRDAHDLGSSSSLPSTPMSPTSAEPDLTALLGSTPVLHVSSSLSLPVSAGMGLDSNLESHTSPGGSAQLTQLSLAQVAMLDKQLFVWCKLAGLYRRMGEFDSALVSLEKASMLKEAKFDANVLYQRARILEEQGHHGDAALEYERVLALEPEHNGALLHRGIVLVSQGKLDQAELSLKALLRIEPTNHKAWHQLGVIASSRGQDVRAAEALMTALELEAEHTIIPIFLFPFV